MVWKVLVSENARRKALLKPCGSPIRRIARASIHSGIWPSSAASCRPMLTGFKKLYQDGSVREAPCMGHIRRKFYDLMETRHSAVATKAVECIAALYLIEKEIRGRPSEERNARARPLLESMREWLKASLLPTPPQVGDHRGYPLCARPPWRVIPTTPSHDNSSATAWPTSTTSRAHLIGLGRAGRNWQFPTLHRCVISTPTQSVQHIGRG
jgi:hypothetical protein